MCDFGILAAGYFMYDFLTMLLVNMTAGMFLLSLFFIRDEAAEIRTTWVPPFAMSGLVATAGGAFITFAWPLPGAMNMAFGEMSIFYGILMLGASLAVAKHYNMLGVGVYAMFAGAAAVVIGARVWNMWLTAQPMLSSAGFILSGAGGIFAGAALATRARPLRILTAICFFGAACIWGLTGYLSYWMHMAALAGHRGLFIPT